eukprot:m.27514 g.27514  ORF g.27514 m.27514 type:complete len:388 (+) comp11930_c0_seq1:196-1359(+)
MLCMISSGKYTGGDASICAARRCLRALDKGDTLVDRRLELGDGLGQLALLEFIELSKTEVLLDPVDAELDRCGEPLAVSNDVRLDVCALHNALLSLHRADERRGKLGSSFGHREGGRTSACFSLDNLGTSVLDAVRESRNLLSRELVRHRRGGLAEERQDRGTSVSADHRDADRVDINTSGLGNECVRAHNVERGHTKDLLGIVCTEGLHLLSKDRDGRVDRVGDDGDHRVGAVLRHGGGKVLVELGVDREQILSGHPWLAWDSRRDHDDIGTLQSFVEGLGLEVGLVSDGIVTGELRQGHAVARNRGWSVNVRQIRRNTRCSDEVEHGDVGHVLVKLQEQRHGLSDTTGATDNADTGLACSRGGEPTGHRPDSRNRIAREHGEGVV